MLRIIVSFDSIDFIIIIFDHVNYQTVRSYQFHLPSYTVIFGLLKDVDNSKRPNFEYSHCCSKEDMCARTELGIKYIFCT